MIEVIEIEMVEDWPSDLSKYVEENITGLTE